MNPNGYNAVKCEPKYGYSLSQKPPQYADLLNPNGMDITNLHFSVLLHELIVPDSETHL